MKQFETTKELRDHARRNRRKIEEYIPKRIEEGVEVNDVTDEAAGVAIEDIKADEATESIAGDVPKKKGAKKGEEK